MKWFFIYSIVAFVCIICATLFGLFMPERNVMRIRMTIVSVFFHYFILSFFFYKSFTLRNKTFFWWIASISVPILFFAIKRDLANIHGRLSFFIANLFLLIFCVIYYYQLFTSFTKQRILWEPSFWIVNGIFLSMAMVIPFFAVCEFLKVAISRQYFDILNSVGSFAYGVMHLFFTKAYICSVAPKKVL